MRHRVTPGPSNCSSSPSKARYSYPSLRRQAAGQVLNSQYLCRLYEVLAFLPLNSKRSTEDRLLEWTSHTIRLLEDIKQAWHNARIGFDDTTGNDIQLTVNLLVLTAQKNGHTSYLPDWILQWKVTPLTQETAQTTEAARYLAICEPLQRVRNESIRQSVLQCGMAPYGSQATLGAVSEWMKQNAAEWSKGLSMLRYSPELLSPQLQELFYIQYLRHREFHLEYQVPWVMSDIIHRFDWGITLPPPSALEINCLPPLGSFIPWSNGIFRDLFQSKVQDEELCVDEWLVSLIRLNLALNFYYELEIPYDLWFCANLQTILSTVAEITREGRHECPLELQFVPDELLIETGLRYSHGSCNRAGVSIQELSIPSPAAAYDDGHEEVPTFTSVPSAVNRNDTMSSSVKARSPGGAEEKCTSTANMSQGGGPESTLDDSTVTGLEVPEESSTKPMVRVPRGMHDSAALTWVAQQTKPTPLEFCPMWDPGFPLNCLTMVNHVDDRLAALESCLPTIPALTLLDGVLQDISALIDSFESVLHLQSESS
ncbi:hypothetical protein CALCODRAFT_510485 [Calocera cornea HHB12733]|uniref:Uncharacterized protein n=1 Tax=Calocera cornea HHB12733 TaxID=1353952 RepID=A0A165EGD1_9BASI|nr:hypothetical protein CALCODRAFT_510485 [Calocera cornea HHB12733]